MIEVSHLTKVYKTGKQSVVAVNDISFTLPDTGMVFVVGKSGCGKSTLLNMLGGLDKQTSGDIFVDGAPFSSFTERNFDCFRNSYVGFVFQDYCLMERLSVYDNVALALQLQNDSNEDTVDEILRQVDVEEYANRYPKQLSGGQRQRVAIARALVKRPKLVLADEPTGNLDGKSSEQVLDVLKAYAQNHLVLVVSHNRQNADDYADRIIELSDGKILSDTTRNLQSGDLEITDSEIVMQKGLDPSPAQVAQINERLAIGKPVRLRKVEDRFLTTQAEYESAPRQTPHFPDKRLSMRGHVRMFCMFTRKQAISLALTLLLVISLVSLLGVSQMFLQFNPTDAIVKLLQDSETEKFALQKGYIDKEGELATGKIVRITDDEVQKFYDSGYEGKIYPMYNVCLTTGSGDYSLERFNYIQDTSNFGGFFARIGNGVLVCDREYLEQLYGDENGELEVLSGKITDDDESIIITDYFAESILRYTPALYGDEEDFYREITNGKTINNRYKVCAVINTGYKERYADLVQAILDGATYNDLIDDEQFSLMLSELNTSLNTAYSFNPNFYDLYCSYDATTYKTASYFADSSLTFEGKKYSGYQLYAEVNKNLHGDELSISKAQWRQLTGLRIGDANDTYWNSLKGKKITLNVGEIGSTEQIYTHEFTIKDTVASGGMRVSVDVMRELRTHDIVPFKLYFSDVSNTAELFRTGVSDNFFTPTLQFRAVQSITGAVKVFQDFFMIIVVALYVICVGTLVGFGVNAIKTNIFEVGVLRALGTKTHNLAIIFAVQMLLVGLVICLVSVLGMWAGVHFGNKILVQGFAKYTRNPLAVQITVIRFNHITALVGGVAVLILAVLASVVPIVFLRKVKPRQIIVAKE